MRMIMGLDRPTSGTVTVNGKPYRQHRALLREVGALLEASAVHLGRSARSHLRSMAATHDIKASRPRRLLGRGGHASLPFPVQASRASLTPPLRPHDGSVEDPYDACHVDLRTATSMRRSSRLTEAGLMSQSGPLRNIRHSTGSATGSGPTWTKDEGSHAKRHAQDGTYRDGDSDRGSALAEGRDALDEDAD
jgi:hypothetical protein